MPNILRFPRFTVKAMFERSHVALGIEEQQAQLTKHRSTFEEQNNLAMVAALDLLAAAVERTKQDIEARPFESLHDGLDLAIDTLHNVTAAREKRLHSIREFERSIADEQQDLDNPFIWEQAPAESEAL